MLLLWKKQQFKFIYLLIIFIIQTESQKYQLHSSNSIQMSSESDYNSSQEKGQNKPQRSRSRSRQRKKNHGEGKDRDRERQTKVKSPQMSSPLMSFKHFCYLQTEKFSTQTITKAYQKYKKEWQAKQNQQFLKTYKKDAWFAEKYDPQVLDLLQRDRKQNIKRLNAQFLTKLEAGYYDKVDLKIKDPSHLGVVEQIDEEEDIGSNLSYIMNQTYDVHMNTNFNITASPYYGFDQDLNTIFIKSVPRSISRYDIRGVVEKLQGYKYLTMSDPVKKNGLTRFCWIQFENEQACSKAVLTLSGLMIKNETLTINKSITKVKRVKVLKNYPTSRMQSDVDTLLRLIIKLDEEVGIQDNRLIERQFNSLHTKFDTFLLYLRKVHAYDYFTSTSYENERILSLKVGSCFLRVEADYQELPDVQTVFKKIQEKSEERISKGSEIPDYMGFLREEMENLIKQSDKGEAVNKQIWKCMLCDKKFKSCQFLAKHMISKHEDVKFKKIEIIMERLYLKDPFKITFSTLNQRDQRQRRPYVGGGRDFYKRDRRRDYKDLDEPEGEKTVKAAVGGRPMVNFLDI